MTWIAAVVAGLVVLASGPVVRRWWLDRAKVDPRRDPVASRITEDRRRELDVLLVALSDPAGTVERGLAICAVDDVFSWRAGLRRLLPAVEQLADDDDSQALRAEHALLLGEIALARGIVGTVSADHWRACGVRASLYELDGDVERAESAWVAAIQLAPPDRHGLPSRRLEALRRRHGRRPTPTQQLWDRPR